MSYNVLIGTLNPTHSLTHYRLVFNSLSPEGVKEEPLQIADERLFWGRVYWHQRADEQCCQV